MDPNELIKELLKVKFLLLPNPHLAQNQSIFQELVHFSEIFQVGQSFSSVFQRQCWNVSFHFGHYFAGTFCLKDIKIYHYILLYIKCHNAF